jgi:hypothetical protein
MNKTCKKPSEKNPENDKRLSSKKNVKCKCPKCQKIFIKKMLWSGTLPARKFCDKCIIINKNYLENSYSINFS